MYTLNQIFTRIINSIIEPLKVNKNLLFILLYYSKFSSLTFYLQGYWHKDIGTHLQGYWHTSVLFLEVITSHLFYNAKI